MKEDPDELQQEEEDQEQESPCVVQLFTYFACY